MTPDRHKGWAPVPTPGGDHLREALRAALDRLIDPDDDTILTPGWVGGFTRVPTESVIDDLMEIVGPLHHMYLEAMASLGRVLDKEQP